LLIAALDIGSVVTKALLWSAAEDRLLARNQVPSAWQPGRAAREALAGLDLAGRPGPLFLAATGYGRDLLDQAEPAAALAGGLAAPPLLVNEITALARGLHRLAPDIRLALDVGGQDAKALSLDEGGRVKDFILNDKCAAGAGVFVDSLRQSFDLDYAGFDRLAASGVPVSLNSMCAVFAQTELVALVARGVSRADLAAGVLAALATRLQSQCGRLFQADGGPVALTGGLSRSACFTGFLARALGRPVAAPPEASHLAALGAALLAAEKINPALNPSKRQGEPDEHRRPDRPAKSL
jgi:predicted CoA-substrate-specific enzyme activase